MTLSDILLHRMNWNKKGVEGSLKCTKRMVISLLLGLGQLLFFSEGAMAAPTPPAHVSLDGIFTTDLGVAGNSATTAGDIANITDGSANQVGALWSTQDNLLDFTKDFTMVSYISQSSVDGKAGDGLMFVLQSLTNTPTWFTYSGASMGALGENKYKGALGIPNSIGIEFDLYGNRSTQDGFFDNGISSIYHNNHVAIVYPGIAEEYTDNFVLLGTSTRYLNHRNVFTDIDLANGEWNRLEMDWKTDPTDYTKGILTFNLNGRPSVQIDSSYLNSQIFQNGTVSQAYWGFTGSTGPTYRANQSVIFRKVPGLVNALTKFNVFDKQGKPIPEGDTVKGNSELNVQLSAQWLDGKQNWQDILSSLQLPEGVVLVPNTTKIDDVLIDDSSVWQNNTLTTTNGQIADLGEKVGNVQTTSTISFTVKTKNDHYTQQTISNQFTGKNAIYTTTPFSFNIAPISLSTAIIAPKDQTVIVDNDLTSLKVEAEWASYGTTLINQVLGVEQNSQLNTVNANVIENPTTTTGTLSHDILPDFMKLAYGEFIVDYTVLSSDGLSSEMSTARITLYKQNAPTIKLNTSEQLPAFKIGKPVTLPVSINDKDSSKITLTAEIEGQEKTNTKEVVHLPGATTAAEAQYDTTGLSPGKYTFNVYGTDSEGNKSNVISFKDVVVEGELKLASVPLAFSNDSIQIGGAPVKIDEMGKIAVLDERINDKKWILKASLLNTNFINKSTPNGKPMLANDDFFYYQFNGEKKYISTEPIDLFMNMDEVATTEFVLDQNNANGFYYNPNSAMALGNYQATVNWSLVSAPS
jgi:hypothetical protein